MEVKRSRRYRYPVSFLLVGLDKFDEKAATLPAAIRTTALAEALTFITRGLRDIDLAIPHTDHRFLIFLPHTPRQGAIQVAGRLRDELGKLKTLHPVTASVGVASYEPGVSEAKAQFGALLKAAIEALQKAQAAGGNRVEASGERVRRDRISMG
jgi:diguanylate cyclase (GGDEF)-like protein